MVRVRTIVGYNDVYVNIKLPKNSKKIQNLIINGIVNDFQQNDFMLKIKSCTFSKKTEKILNVLYYISWADTITELP